MNSESSGARKTGALESSPDETDIGVLRSDEGIFPVVGLGGSAGGIAALLEFFAAMPVNSGMAFVVILHLSPHHESTLTEMLQRSTAMPVKAAKDGITIEPNSVYVIPPGKFLVSEDGHLGLIDAKEPRGKRVSVEYFFRTLAETHGAQSLAVVLSGAGDDGALGLKRIKELGGLTIAQDPDEAEQPDMPRAAIATGVVDWVLRVREMPAKLMTYMKQREKLALPDEEGTHPTERVEISPDELESALRDVLAFLHTRTGRDFSCYKPATILRRIGRRIQVNGLADLPSYLVYLRTHAGESVALLQDLLISVTNFFRDPTSFAALERMIPELFRDKQPSDTVRVWVAGCATGEEAYSIAILLCEHAATLVGPPQLQIFATDLDEDVIREARDGHYPESIAADVSESRLRHFFIHEQGRYRVRRAVRELVLFAPHDLLKDSPFSRLDLVSCRNLLIYLKREAQSRAFDIFHFALRPGGRLFLGTSEAVDEGSPLFTVLDKKHRIYVQRPGPQRLITVPTGPGTLARALAIQERMKEQTSVQENVSVASETMPDKTASFDSGITPGELHFRLIELFSPPSILINSAHEILHLSASAGRFLQFAAGEPTRNLLKTVHPMLRVELRAALYAAAQNLNTSAAFRVPVDFGSGPSLVNIRVTPAGEFAPEFLLVVFEEYAGEGSEPAPPRADADQTTLYLERELEATKSFLRETIEESEASTEELKASNEELQAMNEELRSATEELETSREETQSINEELTSVNEELKSNIDQLARSNNDLQNLMAATDIATIFLDRELCIQRFTPSARALFNFIPADLGRPLSELSRNFDYPEIVADAKRSLEHLQTAQREVSAGEHYYITRILPYRTADDYIAGVVLTFLDITERKRSEQKLARLAADSERQRRLYETVLTNTPDFVYVFSLDHRVLYANDALIAMWGLGHDGAIGKTFLEIGYEPWHAEMHDREIDQVRATRQPIRGEVPFNGTHGRREYDYIFVPVIGADGEVEAVAGTTRDVTERKEIESQLRANHDTFFGLIQNNPFGVYVVDADFRLRQVSQGAQKAFETINPLLGRDFAEVLRIIWPEPFASEAIRRFRHTLDTGEPYSAPGSIERRADRGTVEAYDWRIERINLPDGRYGVVCYFYDLSERQRWEAALRNSEERLRLALTAARMVAWEWTPADRKLRVSENAADVFGLEPGIGLHLIDQGLALLHPDDMADYRNTYQKAIDELGSYQTCYRLLRPDDGRMIWIEERGHAVLNDSEGGMRLYGVSADITTRQRAETALRESEERLAFVRRSSGVGFWCCDLPFDVLQWDDLVKAHFHLPPDATVTIQTFYDRIHPDDREPTRRAIDQSIAGRTQYAADFRTVDPETGAITWVRAIGRTFYATDGNPTRFDGIALDVSDQKRAEISLKESEQRFREMANAAPAMIWVTNAKHECTFLSQSWFDFTGQRIDDGLILGWINAVHPDDRETAQATFLSAAERRESFELDYRLQTAKGDYRWTIDAGKPRINEAGEFCGFVGSVTDAHERHEFQTALDEARVAAEAANESKSAFLANMSHEIRTPMTAILGYTDLLRDLVQQDDAIQHLQTIRNNGYYLLEIINDILDLSKIEAGKLEVECERFQLYRLIEDVRSIMEIRAKEGGLTLEVQYEGKLPEVIQSDAKRLKQILINLVGNAIKFTHTGKVQIRVRFDASTRRLQFDVIDTGIGISSEQMVRLFKPFSQGDASVSRHFGGTGLGLIISQRLAEMLGGSVTALSTEGVGSTFSVSIVTGENADLTLVDYENKLTRTAANSTNVPGESTTLSCHVLVVDDRRDIRFLSKYILTKSGATVKECEDGLIAVEHVSACLREGAGPDLILLDMQMPNLDGYATARRLRSLGYLGPIVALTADAMQSDMNKCLEAGCNDYLSKPIDKAQLLAKVADLTKGNPL